MINRKTTLLSILIFLFYSICFSQAPIEKKSTLNKIDSLNDLSRDYSFVDNVKALQYANEALELSLFIDYKKGQAFAFRNMSSVYSSQDSYAESIEYINMAVNIFEELKDEEGIANCNISLGHTFGRLEEDSLSFEFHKKAYDYFSNTRNINRKAITSHNLARAHYVLLRFDSAKILFQNALKLSEESNSPQLLSSCLSYLGEIEFKAKRFDAAQVLFEESQKIFTNLGTDAQKYATMSAFYHLAMIYSKNGDKTRMIQMLENATQIIEEFGFPFFVTEVYKELIDYYFEVGDITKVKNYTNQYARIITELNQVNLKDKTKIALDLIQSRDLEKIYSEKIKSSEINEKIVEANSKVINVLIGTSFFLIILLSVIVYQFFRNKRNSQAITSIYENAGTALVLLNHKSEIIKWNRVSTQLLGEVSEKLVGKNFFKEFISKDSQLKPLDLENSYLNEFEITTVDGKAKEISISCSRTFINGNPFYVLFILDASEFKRLQRLNDFYQIILEKSNEIAKIGTWEMSYSSFLHKEMPIISSQVLEILEIEDADPEIMSQLTWTSFFNSEESIQKLMAVFEDATENNKTFDLELNLTSYKGNDIWIRFIGSLEFVSKSDIKLFGTIQDITEVKNGIKLIEENLSREQELNKLKSRFISMASHEFRTPLATITTSVELIQMNIAKIGTPNTNVLDKHAYGILNQVDRLEKTLDGILMLEKTIQGKIQTNITEVEIEKLLIELIENINLPGDERKPILNIKSDLSALYSDEHLLHHILENVISNSLKYSVGKESPIISVLQDDQNICVEILDFGIGIPESDKSGLFNSFYRAKNTTGIKGTGLGLSIVKEFVSLINAEIEIDSVEGEGTKVTLLIPFDSFNYN
ncbi:ATP-binding protein [Belliella sp. R4-6]|uniref:histidine kinase n=1 Tax=Belliella alkalica TaxID=1730871 RepID=A0ABS9V7U1_9BACT|nr:ATP-binding protein [Belliella alkalica]MCH7412030.1 ATP-binding protein [Belliella alkalica]